MNNPLKLFFLIFHLVPSLTSSVNNYSQPLPETELQMGQNASEIVKRDGAITLVGGTRMVEVFSVKGEPQQKELTLSFPVVRKLDGKKGFLVPFSLHSENYLVDGTKIGGGDHVLSPAGFFDSEGISYAFLDIYPEFWSDKNSPNVLYNDCDKAGCKTVLIPLLPTPNQEQLPLKTNVCAYGGASGYVCGEIVDFAATVTSYGLQFHPVTKVSMNKPCLEGDEGAPVYIPTNVPNSKQMVANAVGQVIRDEKNSEINMWYYSPLKKIFEHANLPHNGGLDLAVGEEKESISVYGGMKVQGYSPSGRELCQRPCTLSFPVSLNNNKGFLTSYVCAISSVFVTEPHSTHVGQVDIIGYKPELGLEYSFVRVYSPYLSDDISHKVDYSHCAEIEQFLPIIPTPSQPLSVGDKVHAYGGSDRMVIGEILETGVTITITKPGSCGKETAELHDVVKVKMNKGYYSGDLGAPVYIPLQVPDSTQMIASPVGQVVEVHNWKAGDNTWYYIPLDRILKDSGLKLDIGDLSSLLPKPDKPNNENLNNVPLTDNLTMSSNGSEVVPNHLEKRRFWWARPSYMIWFSPHRVEWREDAQPCNLGFPVRRVEREGGGGHRPFKYGFLTLGSCLSTDIINNRNAVFNPSFGSLDRFMVGYADTSDLVYSWAYGLNFAVIKLLADVNGNSRFWNDEISTQIPIPEGDRGNSYGSISDQIYRPNVGSRVCASVTHFEFACGTVTNLHESRAELNPWVWAAIVRNAYTGNPREDYWENLIKVRLDEIPRGNTFKKVRGSPVYYIERNNDINIVRPVGILVGYRGGTEQDERDRCVPVYYMLCVSIDAILTRYPEYQIISASS